MRVRTFKNFKKESTKLIAGGVALPTLQELVEESKKFLEEGHFFVSGKPETLTRQFLLEPFLDILGWSTEPTVTYYYVREFSGGMDRKWEDYVLLQEDRPLVFLETKPLFDRKLLSTQNVNELLNYMKEFNRKNRNGHRVDWGVLTNFKEIHVFYVSDKKPFFSCVFTDYVEKFGVLKELLSVEGIRTEGIERFFAEKARKRNWATDFSMISRNGVLSLPTVYMNQMGGWL